jgi:hypothetical protein
VIEAFGYEIVKRVNAWRMNLEADVAVTCCQAYVADFVYLRDLISYALNLTEFHLEEYIRRNLVSHCTRIDDGGKLNDLVLNETFDTCSDRALSNTERPGYLGARTPAVFLQAVNNRSIDVVDNSGHDGDLPFHAVIARLTDECSANPSAYRLTC